MASTPRTMRPEKRPQSSGALIVTGSRSPSVGATRAACGRLVGRAGDGGNLLGNTGHRHAVGEVGRELEQEHALVQRQRLAQVGAGLERRRQARRCLHGRRRAKAPWPSTACPGFRRRASVRPRSRAPPGRLAPGSASAVTSPGRTLGAPQTTCSGFAGSPGIDLADREPVGIRMLARGQHARDHHVAERRRNRRALLDLEPATWSAGARVLRRSTAGLQ